jgi:hypothetical protein
MQKSTVLDDEKKNYTQLYLWVEEEEPLSLARQFEL